VLCTSDVTNTLTLDFSQRPSHFPLSHTTTTTKKQRCEGKANKLGRGKKKTGVGGEINQPTIYHSHIYKWFVTKYEHTLITAKHANTHPRPSYRFAGSTMGWSNTHRYYIFI